MPISLAARGIREPSQSRLRVVVFLAAMLLLVSPAHANVGTPLIWSGILHLTVGNLFLGIAEGVALALLARVRMVRSCLWMILANYVSAWLGLFMLRPLHAAIAEVFGGASINTEKQVLLLMLVAAWLGSILVEMPFAWLAARRSACGAMRLVVSMVVVQSASYLALYAYYRTASSLTLLTETAIDPSLSFVPRRDDAWYYYMRADRSAIERVRLDGSHREHVAPLPATGHYARLVGRSPSAGDRSVTLQLLVIDPDEHVVAEFATGIEGRAVPARLPEELSMWQDLWSEWPAFHEDPSIDHGVDRERDIEIPIELVVRHPEGQLGLALSTPFASWYMDNTIITRDGLVIFDLGQDQVAILEPRTARVGMLARGMGGVLVIEDGASPASPDASHAVDRSGSDE
ncbi:MAG: hypothetical protein RBS39_08570 [Phycisphaerales bacterium]|nr:hypothetical protein [Phycisphaerales bacterium]